MFLEDKRTKGDILLFWLFSVQYMTQYAYFITKSRMSPYKSPWNGENGIYLTV